MHELSLAAEIVDVALKVAGDSGAAAVTTVHITMNAASHVDRSVLSQAFEIAAVGTRASEATLDVTVGRCARGEVAVTAIDVNP
ncbi:MAG TPA: hydrogenase/urease maturation nickel metallochaperone HypA [Acidimicrobiia bacterium]|nr:hydrogenase/urease maturation nickel metallochaperone HypA [Acidimicrobiia bacterium]